MISINGQKLELNHFPDGTFRLNYPTVSYSQDVIVYWKYESEEELIALIYIVKHIRTQMEKEQSLILSMPYVPNARMDRVKSPSEVFTLKYFTEVINDLKFDKVRICDPHSNVTTALLNNVELYSVKHIINSVIEEITSIESTEPTIFYPDKGACDRYTDILKLPSIYGNKVRDWSTGFILGLEIMGSVKKDKPVLIIDDICSKGGTFYHAANHLKVEGAGNIYLYVTHCENSILQGDLINSELITKIYTTDSLFTGQHDLITVL